MEVKSEKSHLAKLNGYLDQYITQQPLLPGQQQQPKIRGWLASRPFRFTVLAYILFSILFTASKLTSFLVFGSSNGSLAYQRSYDPLASYSLMSNMSQGLKMSKLFDKASYDALQHVQPYWKKATAEPKDLDVTMVTTTTPETWNELIALVDNWDGPISATMHLSKKEHGSMKHTIDRDYSSNIKLANNVDLHLIESNQYGVSVMIPLNVERNMARIYARSDHVLELPSHTLIATNLRSTLLKHQSEFAKLMRQGDMLVVPTFQSSVGAFPQTKKEVVGLVEQEKTLGLYDVHYDLNQGPTDFETWKRATKYYSVERYTMDYEPIVIQSKSVQPWCSERFVDKRSACLLSSYLAGNDFKVLPNDFAIFRGSEETTSISVLDNVIEKRLYAKFYWEQCVYQGRQLDALGLWNTPKSEHIRQQCSRVIQNWGHGLIGKPE